MVKCNPDRPDAEFHGPSTEEILSCIADAVISTDEQGKILLFNPAATKLFGHSATEVLGTSIQRLIPLRFRESHARDVAGFGSAPSESARAMAGEREVFGLRRDGTEFPAEAMLSRRFIDGKALLTVVIRDVSYRNALDEQRNLIASEMAHRFKNIMAVVNAVISLTARSVSSVEEFRDVLEDRLRSISRTQETLLGPRHDVQLIELVELELAPFRNNDDNRIRARGPELTVSTQQAVSMSLVLHELATNAAKYGSLSNTEGSVQLDWTVEHDGEARYLLLDWIERGGPPVSSPVKRGFGSDLIRRCFGPSSSVVKYDPEGLTAHFRVRL
jgi:PAS domain S-box-containing protein